MTQHDVLHDECSVETVTIIYLLTTQFISPVVIMSYVHLQITCTSLDLVHQSVLNCELNQNNIVAHMFIVSV
jgi:hypothetical protein